MHMTVGKFAIPTINRCDINRFHSAASKSMKQEDGSSSPAFVDVGDAINVLRIRAPPGLVDGVAKEPDLGLEEIALCRVHLEVVLFQRPEHFLVC